MTSPRRDYRPAETLALTTQVDGVCPRCGRHLFYKKKGTNHKQFDLAHIYPLNPSDEEVAELDGAPRLAMDPNDPDNIIPLCTICHTVFDKPRTRAEYDELFAKKKYALERIRQRELRTLYPLEAEIRQVIQRLDEIEAPLSAATLAYEPQRLDEKFDDTLPYPTRHKIRTGVRDYFSFVKDLFLELEKESPAASERIATQVKSFYLKQEGLGLSQGAIYHNVVQWLQQKAEAGSRDATEVVAAFFVQNCEVFR